MNNWQSVGTILAGVAALITAIVGLFEKFHVLQNELHGPVTAEHIAVASNREFGIVNDPDGWVFLRQAPTTSSNAIAKLLNDSHVEIIGREGNWFKISTSSGREGFVYKDRLLLVDMANSERTIIK